MGRGSPAEGGWMEKRFFYLGSRDGSGLRSRADGRGTMENCHEILDHRSRGAHMQQVPSHDACRGFGSGGGSSFSRNQKDRSQIAPEPGWLGRDWPASAASMS